MKMQTRLILAGCLAIVTFDDFGTSVEVSSMIDLDSNENEATLANQTFGMNPKKSVGWPESILRAPKQSTFISRRGGEFVRANEPRKRRIYPSDDNSAKQPKIINNIQIVVNGNDSVSKGDSCEYGVCNVSVSSKPDEEGNIITEVHLSIVTKAKSNIDHKIDDVPVINGFRGVSKDYDNNQAVFRSINSPRSMHTHLHRDNIPQIQTNYQEYGEPWYGRTFRRPQVYWNYHIGDYGNVGFRDRKTWPRDKPTVDDKIESPLSKTKVPSDDT